MNRRRGQSMTEVQQAEANTRARRWVGLTLAVVVLWVWLSLASGQFN